MTVGPRIVIRSAVLLGLATLLASPVRGQESSHRLWQSNLTPEQVKAAFAKMGAGEFGDVNPFKDMVKKFLLEKNPALAQNPKQVQDAIEKLTANKQLMDQLKEYAKTKQTDPGRPGQLDPNDISKFLEGLKGKDLPKLPDDLKKIIPKQITDPKQVEDPKQVTVPPTIDPARDPKINPKPPANVPPEFPNIPMPPRPDRIPLDENPFPSPAESTDPRMKSLQAFASVWERNVGPLNETPEVQRALFELVGDNGFDFDFLDDKGNSFWDLLKDGNGGIGGDGNGFGDLFNGSSGGNWNFGNWEFPKLGKWLGTNNWNLAGSDRPRPQPNISTPNFPSGGSSGSGSGWGLGLSGFGPTWLPFAILAAIALTVFVWFWVKNLPPREDRSALDAAGLGPWPVDPRSLNTREDVVKAFEYLSVLICGPSARNWTHGTIAAALADLATTHEREALGLARLYELARYAPLNEPLTPGELREARDLVCSLAGVSA